jgi:rubrerythrin
MLDNKENVDVDDLLIEAMDSEIKSKQFYKEASMKAKSQAGKKLFQELAEFEQNHYERIKAIIESRNQGLEIKDSVQGHTTHAIRAEIEGEIEANKDEVITEIHLAIESEKNAQLRYQRIAEIIDDDEGKQIFKRFVEEERNHQKILEDQFYHISNKGTIVWE